MLDINSCKYSKILQKLTFCVEGYSEKLIEKRRLSTPKYGICLVVRLTYKQLKRVWESGWIEMLIKEKKLFKK